MSAMPRMHSSQQAPSFAPHYQTFPTDAPKSGGNPPPHPRNDSVSRLESHQNLGTPDLNHDAAALPRSQLVCLAVIALAEQTAFNSISPYLPDMASSFPDVADGQVGFYVGLVASSFAAAQFVTNFGWGYLSDRIGRKPVILSGTLLTAACFVAFGFCRTLRQAIFVQALMGMVNGNQGIVSTCLGEITDRSNQSKAFTYLPIIYGIGGITGPIVGGLLVNKANGVRGHPYLLPNLVSAAVLLMDLVVTMLFLEESLEDAKALPPLGKRVGSLFARLWQFTSSTKPTYMLSNKQTLPPNAGGHGTASASGATDDDGASQAASESAMLPLFPSNHSEVKMKDVVTKDTILILVTYFIFQLSNIAYNSLYPIFAQAKPPSGRNLSPQEIGISLAFAGLVTILFQVGLFGQLRDRIGNKTTYRVGLGGLVVSFLLMPLVAYADSSYGSLFSGKVWLWIELGAVLVVKTISAVAGLTSALLLITNSAPAPSVLGTFNGLAQTLSALGRAAGPFVSGSLFTLGTRLKHNGEALVFGTFASISLIGFLISWGIKGGKLEAKGYEGEWSISDEDGNIVEHEAEHDEMIDR